MAVMAAVRGKHDMHTQVVDGWRVVTVFGTGRSAGTVAIHVAPDSDGLAALMRALRVRTTAPREPIG